MIKTLFRYRQQKMGKSNKKGKKHAQKYVHNVYIIVQNILLVVQLTRQKICVEMKSFSNTAPIVRNEISGMLFALWY